MIINQHDQLAKAFMQYLKDMEIKERIAIENILKEYKEFNNLEWVTNEEMTDLFGESVICPAYYETSFDTYYSINDYEWKLLLRGIDIVIYPFNDISYRNLQTEDGYDLGDAETMSEGEYEHELSDQFEVEEIEFN